MTREIEWKDMRAWGVSAAEASEAWMLWLSRPKNMRRIALEMCLAAKVRNITADAACIVAHKMVQHARKTGAIRHDGGGFWEVCE